MSRTCSSTLSPLGVTTQLARAAAVPPLTIVVVRIPPRRARSPPPKRSALPLRHCFFHHPIYPRRHAEEKSRQTRQIFRPQVRHPLGAPLFPAADRRRHPRRFP